MTRFKIILENAVWNLFNRPTFADFIDILVVAFIVYHLILIIKETRAIALVIGVFLLILITGASDVLGLKSLSWLLSGILSNGVLVFVILFQSEIRKVIEQLGLIAFKDSFKKKYSNSEISIVDNIVNACLNLSKRRVGALIVFEQRLSINDIVKTGTYINSDISAPLLENIFEPNTPLHDGAVIIRGKKIIAAQCILMLTNNEKISKELGTRHRAAIGVSEATDAIALIVSEETGVISIAEKGVLERHLDEKELIAKLESLYSIKEVHVVKSFLQKIIKGNKHA